MSGKAIRTEILSQAAYSTFGDVLAARPDVTPKPANQGTAQRFDRLGSLQNLRPEATANLCVFQSSPFQGKEFEVKLLERHEFSTQVFIPMACSKRYLVLVALGKNEPDLTTLRAFVAGKDQGVTYHPGVWHHPLIALDETTDFACVVYEDDSSGDCQVARLKMPLKVQL